jgi:CRISPR-associated protein Cas1
LKTETPEDEFDSPHARSVSLAGSRVGVTCRIDLLEKEGKRVTPVEYKRGRPPDIPEGAYEPDRVQLCPQGSVLKENGFQCDQGRRGLSSLAFELKTPGDWLS